MSARPGSRRTTIFAHRVAAHGFQIDPIERPGLSTLGQQVFDGKAAGAACIGCHGSDGKGTPLGPDLTSGKWLWSDGSVNGLQRTITAGVPNPKNYRGPMPPMGGAQLSPEQVQAVAAYVWALGHPQ